MCVGADNFHWLAKYTKYMGILKASCRLLQPFDCIFVEQNIIGFALYVSEPALGLPPDCFTEILI